MRILLMICFIVFVTDVIGQTVIVNSDGTHSTVHGNVIVNPDGTHSTVHGNVIVNPDGTHSIVVKNDNTNTDGATEKEVYKSETLLINQISEHVYQHISFLDFEGFGKVSCNGMIIVKDNEAIIFDTPTDNETSRKLIDWVTQSLKSKIIAVIPTHYHIDNLGGLDEFHRQGIASYAYNKTIQITKENGLPVPQHGFDKKIELEVGNEKVHIEFFGEGHTCDNIVGYFPKVKKIMVGHGKSGGLELLDYTINLFE
ncbi:hypothetical protein AGMMS50239_04520 [Bacteroidia bacterium]|nr:hypothetical protein AGMMS50239_04520 [Bacteroidia bacterium]